MLISFCDRVRKMKELGLERRDVIRARPSKSFDAEFGGGFMRSVRLSLRILMGIRSSAFAARGS